MAFKKKTATPAKKQTATKEPEAQPEPVNVRIRYETMDAQFASQFIVNTSREELILNLSPGYISEPGTNERLLPIQTRIALTPQGAARLVNTLSTVLRNTYGTKSEEEAADTPDKSD